MDNCYLYKIIFKMANMFEVHYKLKRLNEIYTESKVILNFN